MKCPNCGSPIKRGDLFCGHCGAKRKKKSKKGLLLLIGFLVVIFGLAAIAYKLLMPGTAQEGTVEDGFVCLSEGFTDIKIVDETSALAAIEGVAKTLGIGNVNEEFSNCREDTVSGNTYYRFYQEYKGVPVYGKSLVVTASADGEGLSLSGDYLPIDQVEIEATVSQEDILSAIRAFFCKKLTVSEINDLYVGQISSDALCIYAADEHSKLAYRLLVEAPQIGSYEVFIDAKNADVLNVHSLLQYDYTYHGAGQMQTIAALGQKRSGEVISKKEIDVYRNPDNYIMADSSRNIELYRLAGENWWGFIKNTGEQEEISWETETELLKYADEVDAMSNIQISYDYFKELSHISTDGKGNARIYILTNYCIPAKTTLWDEFNKAHYYNNAWSGSSVEDNYTQILITPASSERAYTLSAELDTMAHEYTHAVVKFTCNLEGKEADAINEGIADIFGELVENWKTGSCDWVHGSRTIHNPSINGYAEFVSDPDNGGGDYSHGHSTVISHAAYLMYTGINGNPNFTALSTDDLAHLFYEALFTLPSDCTFSQFRTLVQNTANVMYKQGRLTYAQTRCVSNAFFQVGIDSTITPVQKQLSIDVYGIGDRPYVDYTLYVWRGSSAKTYDGATVSAEGVSFPLTGEYELCFVDNANDENRTNIKVNVLERGGTETLPVFTQCGTAKIEGPILDLFFPSPDYSLYVPVIEKAIAERPYSGDDYGILYDLDKDGVEELFMLHTYSGGAIPEMGYSIYDINDGALVTRAEKQTLIVMAGGGGCMAGISETDGGTYFYAYSLQIGDVYADSVITVYDQSFSVYKTFEANMETEGTHITQDPYTTSYSIDGSPCTEAEYKLLLSTILPFDTGCFQLENTGRQIGRFYNGQWYGETLTALLNRLKASAEPDVEETINGEDAYREVLDMFYRSIQNGWTELDQEGWDDPCDPDSVSYLLYSNGTLSSIGALSLSEIGYCIRDIDGNGIPELMVTRKWFSEKYPGIISDLYTLSGGHPIHLASGGDRAWYYLAENDSICFEGSSDAFSNVQCDYSIDAKAGKLKVTQAVIYDAFTNSTAPWYYSETEYYDPQAYDFIYDALTGISEEEAQRIIASFPQHKAYPLTTFDQYQPGGQRVEIDKADENGSLNIPVLEGTWANEFSEDAFALFYLTEFSSDGTVVQHGYRNIDKGRFQITGANTVVATFDDNYWDSPGVGLQKIADYSYTVTYTYDKSSDTLFADYSTEFENAVNSNANDGTLSRWHDGHDTVTGKDTAPKKLSESDAQRIAEWYWQDSLETPSEIWADIAAKAHGTKTYQGKEFYYCALTGRVDGHRTTLDYLYIDAETGDCYFGIDHPEELIYEGSAII